MVFAVFLQIFYGFYEDFGIDFLFGVCYIYWTVICDLVLRRLDAAVAWISDQLCSGWSPLLPEKAPPVYYKVPDFACQRNRVGLL